MTIQTVVTWNPPASQECTDACAAAAAQAALEGKTDNKPIRNPVPPPYTVSLTWTTLTDAEDWIAFVLQYGPVSATIINS